MTDKPKDNVHHKGDTYQLQDILERNGITGSPTKQTEGKQSIDYFKKDGYKTTGTQPNVLNILSVPKPKGGRPTEYNQELVDIICNYISNGLSLRKLCEKDDVPVAVETIRIWLREHDEFVVQYARARDEQADFYADEMIEIADNESDSNKARVRIDARKWISSKLKPKKYGDKIDMTSDGEKIQMPVVKIIDERKSE